MIVRLLPAPLPPPPTLVMELSEKEGRLLQAIIGASICSDEARKHYGQFIEDLYTELTKALPDPKIGQLENLYIRYRE